MILFIQGGSFCLSFERHIYSRLNISWWNSGESTIYNAINFFHSFRLITLEDLVPIQQLWCLVYYDKKYFLFGCLKRKENKLIKRQWLFMLSNLMYWKYCWEMSVISVINGFKTNLRCSRMKSNFSIWIQYLVLQGL